MRPLRRICVFCGSNAGFDPCYAEAARALGRALVGRHLELVYGGSRTGLMGAVADTVIQGGGSVIGVIPASFAAKVSHQGLNDLRIVGSMHERKAVMFDVGDAFVALPGGLGTLEELSELLTWTQLGLNDKPCGMINVRGYFDSLLAFLDRAVATGFLHREHRHALLVDTSAEALLDRLSTYRAPSREKWIRPGERPPT